MKYWLVYRDPYIGLLKSPYNWVVFHPLYNRKQPGAPSSSAQGYGKVYRPPRPTRWDREQKKHQDGRTPFLHKGVPGSPS